jgi:23S rRNA (adenine2503-C2)-methyltransferase
MKNKPICGLTFDELSCELESENIDPSYALKICYWIYKKRIANISEINNISTEIKDRLSETFEPGLYGPADVLISSDKTEKYLFTTPEGKSFETVYIPEIKRRTLCVSTQAGCRMGCTFCLTGKSGFRGNLTSGEIINQILSNPHAGEITHVVFMGMGEPMDNISEVLRACNIISAQWGLSLGTGKVTVSTVGITYAIKEYLENSGCNLTLSLHSPFSDERRTVIPAENKYPFHEIIDILKLHPKSKRRISVAYIMINGINDSDRHLEALKKLLANTKIRVNLLSYNQSAYSDWTSSPNERMQFYKHNLVIYGLSASIRKSRGNDISAACGLLAGGFENHAT